MTYRRWAPVHFLDWVRSAKGAGRGDASDLALRASSLSLLGGLLSLPACLDPSKRLIANLRPESARCS